MNFKISQQTLNLIQKTKQQKFRSKLNMNSQKFYKRHPDLAPRNVYLRMGRILKLEDVQKAFFDWDKPWYKKVFDKITSLFKKS